MPEFEHVLWGRLFSGGEPMGLVLNVFMAAVALVVGAAVGVPIGVLRAMAPAPVKVPLDAAVGIVRSTPLLLLLIWTYLFIQVVLAVPMPILAVACLTLSLYAITHISDIVRSGAQAVTRGQHRAAQALGLGPIAVARHVVVPVSLRVMMPALTTFATTVFKDSSVCQVIGVVELMQLVVIESSRRPRFLLDYYALIGFLFLLVNLIGTRIAARLEARCRIAGGLDRGVLAGAPDAR